MKRLVYSPRVEAYVRTDSGIIDVSSFIVSGSVNRVLNEVSTAELTIRNPDKMFTKPGDPTFRPMDGITIFGSRYKDRPVQLFTGYLDSTPYLQLFPGICTIKASCTLKRLLHTYWDAGLPYTWDFLEKYDWMVRPNDGTAINLPAQMKNSMKDKDGKEIPAIITDGSLGNLLVAVLREIGNWNKEQIMVERLPKGIIETVSSIMRNFEQDDKRLKEEYDQFLSDLIGQYSGGTGGGAAGGTGADVNFGSAPKTVYCVGQNMSVPPKHMLSAMLTGLVECPDGSGGFGNCQGGEGSSSGWRQETIESYPPPIDRNDVAASARRYFNECRELDSGQSAAVLSQAVQRSAYPERYAEHYAEAERLLDSLRETGCRDQSEPETGGR